MEADQLSWLENRLNDFNKEVRSEAFIELISLAENGQVPLKPAAPIANMHSHTFFSFNAYGYSPSALAWMALKRGFGLMGIVDFDVLDGVDEFLHACDLAGLRGSAGMETRVFVPQFTDREINSPGEPGVYYHMGIGFTTSQAPESAMPVLQGLHDRAERRNRAMVERVNAFLSPVNVDYGRDVLPLTPSGNATERHMIVAYIQLAAQIYRDPAGFWSEKLGLLIEEVQSLLQDMPKFQNLVRSRLMKRGGVGYIEPTPESFPTVEEYHQLVLACEALPCATWLDGTSAGEKDIIELLDLLLQKGIVALNIIPDRNWNISDPAVRHLKIQNLYRIVRLADELALPLNIGTEMNSFGNKLVDDFDAPELIPVRQAFLDGAYFLYGQTSLQRSVNLGYQSEWAKVRLPGRRERNNFYTQAGYHLPPGKQGLEITKRLNPTMSPDEILTVLKEKEGSHV